MNQSSLSQTGLFFFSQVLGSSNWGFVQVNGSSSYVGQVLTIACFPSNFDHVGLVELCQRPDAIMKLHLRFLKYMRI